MIGGVEFLYIAWSAHNSLVFCDPDLQIKVYSSYRCEERSGPVHRWKYENSLPKFCRRKLRIWNSAAAYMKKKKWGDKVGGPRRATIKNGGSKRARFKDSFVIQVESELNLASTQFWLKCCFVKRCLPWSPLSPFSALLSDCYSFSDFIIPPPPLDYKSVPSGQEPHLICSSPEPSTEPDSQQKIYVDQTVVSLAVFESGE